MADNQNSATSIHSGSNLSLFSAKKDATVDRVNNINTNNTQQVRLLNPKYCRLYSKPKYKDLKSVMSNIDDGQTIFYTKCDHILERFTHQCILKLEDQFKEHEELVKKQMGIQNNLMEDIWIQSQRFLMLTRSGVCVKPYPEIVSVPKEKKALSSFDKNLKEIFNSNSLIGLSLENIRSSRSQLNKICDQLDMTVESPYILGRYNLKSLAYIREILDDLFNYFHSEFCKLQCRAQLLDPSDSAAIEDYINLIKPNENYKDNLGNDNLGMENKKCN